MFRSKEETFRYWARVPIGTTSWPELFRSWLEGASDMALAPDCVEAPDQRSSRSGTAFAPYIPGRPVWPSCTRERCNLGKSPV